MGERLRALLSSPRWTILVVLLLVAIVLPAFYYADVNADSDGHQSAAWVVRTMDVAVLVMLYAVLALGLNVVCGDAGLLDLGYVAFVIIGAYTTALLYRLPFFQFPGAWIVCLLLAGLLCAVFGWLRGAPTLHLSGDYYAIVTFAFAQILFFVVQNEVALTGGPKGLKDYPAITLAYDLQESEIQGDLTVLEPLVFDVDGEIVPDDDGGAIVTVTSPRTYTVKPNGEFTMEDGRDGFSVKAKGNDELPWYLELTQGNGSILRADRGRIGSFDPLELRALRASEFASLDEGDQRGVQFVIPDDAASVPFTARVTVFPPVEASFTPGRSVYTGPREDAPGVTGEDADALPTLEYVGPKYLFYQVGGASTGVELLKKQGKFESQMGYDLDWTTRSYYDTILFDFDRDNYHFLIDDVSLGEGRHAVAMGVKVKMPDGVIFEKSPAFFYIVLVTLLLTVFVMMRIQRTRVGRALFAIKANPLSAKSSGIAIWKYKMIAFGVSAFFGGVGGGLLAFKFEILSPNVFTFWMSVIVLCCVVLGGMASVPGVLLGTVALMSLGELLRERIPIVDVKVPEQARFLAFGAILILIMLFRSQGLFPPIGRRAREVDSSGARRFFRLKRGGETNGEDE